MREQTLDQLILLALALAFNHHQEGGEVNSIHKDEEMLTLRTCR